MCLISRGLKASIGLLLYWKLHRGYVGWVWTAPKTADVGIPLRKITSSSILPSTSSWGSCRDVQGPWHHGISFQETMTFKANAGGFCFSCPSLRHETLNFENGSFLGHGGIPSYPFFSIDRPNGDPHRRSHSGVMAMENHQWRYLNGTILYKSGNQMIINDYTWEINGL